MTADGQGPPAEKTDIMVTGKSSEGQGPVMKRDGWLLLYSTIDWQDKPLSRALSAVFHFLVVFISILVFLSFCP